MNKQFSKLLYQFDLGNESTTRQNMQPFKHSSSNIPASKPDKDNGFGLQIFKLHTQPTHSVTIHRQPIPRTITRPVIVREEKKPVCLPVVRTPQTVPVKAKVIVKEPEVKSVKKPKPPKKVKKKNPFVPSDESRDEIKPVEIVPEPIEEVVEEPKYTIMQARLRNRSMFDHKNYSTAPFPVDKPNKENLVSDFHESKVLKDLQAQRSPREGLNQAKRPLVSRGEKRPPTKDREHRITEQKIIFNIADRRKSDLNDFRMDSDEDRALSKMGIK